MKQRKNQDKKIKLRLNWFRYLDKTKNVAKTSRYFGVSRQTLYKYLKRYINYGKKGLLDQSKVPKNIRYIIPLEIKKLVKELRINKLWGPLKISKIY